MLLKLIVLFTAVPLVELWLLLSLGSQIGFWPTFAIAVLTATVGAALAKREGRRVLGGWRDALAAGRVPDEGVLGGVLVLVGGVLLVTPGFLTDLVGLALLFPPTRRLVADRVRAHLERRTLGGPPGGGMSFRVVQFGSSSFEPEEHHRGDVIDVEGEVVEEEKEPPRLKR